MLAGEESLLPTRSSRVLTPRVVMIVTSWRLCRTRGYLSAWSLRQDFGPEGWGTFAPRGEWDAALRLSFQPRSLCPIGGVMNVDVQAKRRVPWLWLSVPIAVLAMG